MGWKVTRRSSSKSHRKAIRRLTSIVYDPDHPQTKQVKTERKATAVQGERRKIGEDPRRGLHDETLAIVRWFAGRLGLLDLSNHQLKGGRDVCVVAGAGFGPGAVEALGQLLAFFRRDRSHVCGEIALVADEHERNPVLALEAVSIHYLYNR